MKRFPFRPALAVVLATLAIAPACKKKAPSEPSSTVTSVVVTGNTTLVNKNQTSQLIATANILNSAPQDVTSTATWASTAPAIAAVSNSGLVTALGNGAATIRASAGGQTGALDVMVTLQAQPQLTVNFQRLCSPFRARMEATIAEASGNAGMNVTGLSLTMRDFFGVAQYSHTFTAAELTTMLGTNHINAGESRVVAAESAYAGNVDTEDSTGAASMTTSDDFGHDATTTVDVPFQHDGC
jgi:hypothetical protein